MVCELLLNQAVILKKTLVKLHPSIISVYSLKNTAVLIKSKAEKEET